MTLMATFRKQLEALGDLKRVWLTTFTLDITFVENWVLPAVLKMDPPVGRMDYEGLQQALNESGIDFRIYCDPRMMAKEKPQRTSIAVYPVSLRKLARSESPHGSRFHDEDSLFHPKVFYLENSEGKIVLGAGSANLTLSGWGRNREAVDFRCVASSAQYKQVKSFFTLLDGTLETAFPVRRKFSDEDKEWTFIHSLSGQTLLQALGEGGNIETLSVWSPYLSDDLAKFITALGSDDLQVELVPDLVQGCMRTPWNDRLQSLIDDDRLRFYASPIPTDERLVMTHAKMWLARSGKTQKLATGSWNFTSPGCCSLPEGRWNVEAGIVHSVARTVTLNGAQWHTEKESFASKTLLEEEALIPPRLPPFDLDVTFDWQTCEYLVTGKWYNGKPTDNYTLILPGLIEKQALSWHRNGALKRLSNLYPEHTDSLLSNHYFTLRCKGRPDWQGIIIETGTAHRRGLRFSTLDDLLNSYVSSADPLASDTIVPRASSAFDEVGTETNAPSAFSPTSYFRLFQAMQQRREWLSQIHDHGRLHSSLFSAPDSLLELVEKTREAIALKPDAVFSWFLACEVSLLVKHAKRRMNQLIRNSETTLPPVTKHMWAKLIVVTPEVKGGKLRRDYLDAIRETCGYA